jgi:hypothetical protein
MIVFNQNNSSYYNISAVNFFFHNGPEINGIFKIQIQENISSFFKMDFVKDVLSKI